MNKDLNYCMNLGYKLEIIEDKEEGGFVLSYPELPGCITCADSIQEGLKLLEDAKKSWMEAYIESNIEIPEPDNINSYSGNFKLRIPKSLHKKIADNSKQEGISMNQYCLYLLSKSISLPTLS